MNLERVISDHGEQIVSRFVAEVEREHLSPPGLPRVLLVDQVPRFLAEIAVEVGRVGSSGSGEEALEGSETARHHGEQRQALSYDLEAMVREYGVLAHCILQVAKEVGAQISIEEYDVLSRCVTVGIAEATAEYISYRDKQLSEQKALSQEERARVEAATRVKDEFVAMISHELRTPLNAILGWTRVMRGGALSEPKREHAFEVIERNAYAQNRLVGDLLDVSSLVTGRIRINPSQVDLASLVHLTIEGLRPAAEAKRISLRTEIDASDALMRGDGDRLQQVVWNLVANAVKFTPKDGVVTIRLRKVASSLELVVEDNGVGIAEGFLPHVFDRFRQSDASPSRRHGGLGIGLSIAKHLVELHGGLIEARSGGEGLGASFIVTLPIGALVSTTPGIGRLPAVPSGTTRAVSRPAGLEGIRVLVVDDDPDARDLLAYYLETCGMEVRLATSASAALSELETFTPHVLVSDIGMPGEDGYYLIHTVRASQSPELRSLPAIALTAFVRNEDRTRAIVEGFNLHLTKPVELQGLVKAVADLAGPSRELSAL